MNPPRLICVLGAECSGKTTLAQALAQHFSGLWVAEQLRQFCDEHGRTPRVDEQSQIVQAQLVQEEQALAQACQTRCAYVFCDTAPLLTAIYSDYYFSDTSLHARARALHARYALTLALAPDLPWVADGFQREGVEVRALVHARLDRELQAMTHPVVYIGGSGEPRLKAAIDAVASLR
jgi:nicotinamide riboside kinase